MRGTNERICPLCDRNVKISYNNDNENITWYCDVCGHFATTEELYQDYLNKVNSPINKYQLSSLTYERFIDTKGSNIPLLLEGPVRNDIDYKGLTPINVFDLLSTYPRTLPEQLDRIILTMSKISSYPGESVKIGEDTLPRLYMTRTKEDEESLFIMRMLREQNLIEQVTPDSLRLTPKGWSRVNEIEITMDQHANKGIATNIENIIDSIDLVKSQFHTIGGDSTPAIDVIDSEEFHSWRSLIQLEMQSLKKDVITESILELTDSFNGWNDKQVFADLTSKLRVLYKNYENYITSNTKEGKAMLNNKVFIVHGHDDLLKVSVARLLENQHLEAIILHEKANEGMTIIEKIEKHSEVGAAIVLFTADDVGGKDEKNLKSRARQNVVYEAGYFAGKLGRDKVIIINNVDEMPSDLGGIVYTPTSKGWEYDVLKELAAIGFKVDRNLV